MICSRFCIGSWRAAFIAAALVLCLAPFARAWTDIDWTGSSSSSVKYWDDAANWNGYDTNVMADGSWRILNAADIVFRGNDGPPIDIRLVNGTGEDNAVVFASEDPAYGLKQTGGWLLVGAWADGELIVTNGTHELAYDLHVACTKWWKSNPAGIFTLQDGTFRTGYWLVVGEGQTSDGTVYAGNGTVNVDGGTLTVGYREGAEASGDGRINIAVDENCTGEINQSGGAVSSSADGTGNAGEYAMVVGVGVNAIGAYNISGGSYIARNGKVLLAENQGSEGTISVSGGSFSAAQITNGLGTATVNLDGGTLAAMSDGLFIARGVTLNVGDNGGTINPNGHNIVIDGDISGSGSLTIAGNGTVTVNGQVAVPGGTLLFTPDAANQAIISAHSDYTLKLVADSVLASSISGGGTIETTGGVSAAADNFYGRIIGTFNATGDSTILGPRALSGTLNINSGVFALGTFAPSQYAWHLDASDTSNVTLENGNVTSFTTPNGARARPWYSRGSSLMTYGSDDNYFAGNPVFHMSRGVAYDYSSGNLRYGALFAVYQSYADVDSGDNEQVLFTSKSNESHDKIRFGVQYIYNKTSYLQRRSQWYAWNNSNSGNPNNAWPLFADGLHGMPNYAPGKKSVVSFVQWYPVPGSRGTRLGTTGNSFEGAIAEIIGLGWTPSLEERAAIELHLMQKWDCSDKAQFAQIASSVDLTMAAGTMLDLNGVDISVASFIGAGTVKNGIMRTSDGVYRQGGGKLSIPAVEGATYVASSSNNRLEISGASGKTVTVRIPANWLDPNSKTYSYIYCDGTINFVFEGEELEYERLSDGRYRFGSVVDEIDYGDYGENTADNANEDEYEDEAGTAFPGAFGWGRFAVGARASSSPTIYHVTNLKDSGTGSLRDAVSKPNRIIVFDVSGVIKISSRITFSSNLYVAGQTAPGEGITVYGNGCSFSGASNIICRYLRWRMGHIGSSGKDCAGIANGANMIFDHCSFSWGLDETFSINPDGKGTYPHNITLQNCIFGQGLMTHSAGGLMQADYVTLFRNLYVDNSTRNNKVKGINQYANNIVYNWKNGCYIMGGDSSGASYCTIESSLFINGPVSSDSNALGGGNGDFHFYGNDNWQDKNRNGILDASIVTHNGGGDSVAKSVIENKVGTLPALPLYAGNTLLENNLRKVGASLPYRDQSDCYMIDEVRTIGRSGGLITYEDTLAIGAPDTWDWWGGTKRTDTDNDGIPDEWESAHGLNPNSAADALAKSSNGRLNIENYINSITADDSQPFLRAPITLRASATTTHSVTLAWRDYTYGEIGFSVEMLENGSWVQKGIAGPNATSYTVGNLTQGTYYDFRVVAVGQNGSSALYSEPAYLTGVNTRQEETGEVDIDSYEADRTLSANQPLWNFSNKDWIEGAAFENGHNVLLNTDGEKTITVNAVVSPKSIVVNGTGKLIVARARNLSGDNTSINKGNTGTLVLTSQVSNNQTFDAKATYTGKVVNHGGTIEFDSIANGGVASSLGMSTKDALNWIFDGGTYKYTGSDASTDRSATFRKDSVLNIANSGTTLTMTGAMEGTGEFILDGAGTLNITDANTFFGNNTRGATIRGGTLYLSTTGDAGSARNLANRNTITKLTLAGGHVKFASKNEEYQTYNVPIYAEDGTSSEMTLATHSYMKSRITGNGDIKFNIQYVRTPISSNLDAFTGNITANGVSAVSGTRPSFYHASYWNYPKTRFKLTGTISMASKSRHVTCHLGGLSGTSGTTLSGSDTKSGGSGTTWYVGYSNSDEEFAGKIDDYNADRKAKGTTSVVKVGTGYWRLTGASEHSGTTTVSAGSLIVNGSLPAASKVYVNDGGTLQGKGSVYGAITVASGGTLQAGDTIKSADVSVDNDANLYMDGGVTLQSGSRVVIPVARNASGSLIRSRLRPKTGSSFKIESDVTLEFDLSEVDALKENETIAVFSLVPSFSGTFAAIEPATPGKGLKWDTSALYTESKYVKVVKDPNYVPDMTPSANDVSATVSAVSELDAYNALDIAPPSESWLAIDPETYKSYFKYNYVDNRNGTFNVEIVGIEDDIVQETLTSAADALVNQVPDGDGCISVNVFPGLYYGIASSDSINIAKPSRSLNGNSTWRVAKPIGDRGFIRIDVASSEE